MHPIRFRWKGSHLLFLALVTVVCYWPLSFGIFSAKNDNITAFLPVRFHISEALRNWELPLWTPYMYLGYPLHGDMQGGAWNPVVWFLSFFGRYNVTSLHAEILIAIFLAGAGMYRLLGAQRVNVSFRLAGAAVYMMCGFLTDVAGSNLPFLWGAALLPFCFAYYYELLRFPTIRYAVRTALAFSALLAMAYPAFIVMAGYIAVIALFLRMRTMRKRNEGQLFRVLVKRQLLAVLLFCCISAPVITSYFHVLPHYPRGNGVSLEQAQVNSLHPECTASVLLPAAPIKNPATAGTDLISKNFYFSIFLLLVIAVYLFSPRNRKVNIILIAMLLCYFFSLGHHTPIRSFVYHLPLMDTFRHPSNARLLVAIGGIVVGAMLLPGYLAEKRKVFKNVTIGFAVLLLLMVLVHAGEVHLLSKWQSYVAGADMRTGIKQFLDAISLPEIVVLTAGFQLVFLLAFMFLLKKKPTTLKPIVLLLVLNAFVAAQSVIPFTLSSKLPPAVINSLVRQTQEGFPFPTNASIEENSKTALQHFDTLGVHGWYQKKPVLTDVYYTPTILHNIHRLDSNQQLRAVVMANPFTYFPSRINPAPDTNMLIGQAIAASNANQDVSQNRVAFSGMRSNGFRLDVYAASSAWLCVQQVYLPGWKATLNGKHIPITTANGGLMMVNLPAGDHRLAMIYRPVTVFVACLLALVTLIAIILLLRNERKA